MQSRHIEYALPQLLAQSSIGFYFVMLTDLSKQKNCHEIIRSDCLIGSLVKAGTLECMSIRNCDVEVDLNIFEAIFLQAFRYVLTKSQDLRRCKEYLLPRGLL
jgi:hypothetical protein